MSYLRTFIVLQVLALSQLAIAASAQDPFARPAASAPPVAAGDQAGAAQADPLQSPPAPNPVVETIVESLPSTRGELARAIKILLDMDEDQLAKGYLNTLVAQDADDAQWASLLDQMGSDFFILLSIRPTMQPEGKQLADRVLDAAWRHVSDPARIDQLVRSLNDSDIHVRSKAYAELSRLRELGAAAILDVFADPSRADEFPMLRTALQKMGAQAEGPLLGGARASDPQVQADSLRALGLLPSAPAQQSLYYPLLSPDSPDLVRGVARAALRRALGQVPAPSELQDALYRDALDNFAGRGALGSDRLSEATLWHWDAQAGKLAARQLSSDLAAQFLAAQRAAEAYALNPTHPRYRQLYLLTQLQFGKLTGGLDGALDPQLLQQYASAFSVDEIQQVLRRALADDQVPAALGACELLAAAGDTNLLRASDGRPRLLIETIYYGDPRLAFAAAQAVAKLDPQQPYPGSSAFLDALVHFAGSAGARKVLVAHPQVDQAQSLGAVAERAGYQSIVASSGREVFELATRDPDIELLILSDYIGNPDYAELIQQLRRDWRSRRIPILLAVREDLLARGQRIAELDPLVEVFPWTLDGALLARALERTRQAGQGQPLTALQRLANAQKAGQYLAQVARQRQPYSFYDLAPYRSAVSQWLHAPGLAQVACAVLGSFGSAAAQRELVLFAALPNVGLADRQAAADAFARAVAQNGLLLTSQEIRDQYDQYNREGRESADSRAVLGSILDTIEGRSPQ